MCPTCHNMRWVLPDVPIDDPRYKAMPCPTCGGPPDLAARRYRNLERLFGHAWMHDSRKLTEYTLDEFDAIRGPLRDGKGAAIAAAMQWALGEPLDYEALGLESPRLDSTAPSHSLVVSGPPGLGKTCLAGAAFVARVDGANLTGLAIEYNALMRAVQSGYRDSTADDTIAAASRVDVLFMDDVGNVSLRGQESDDKYRISYEIINYRYNAQLPTLITTNLSFAQLEAQFDYKFARRLKDGPLWLEMHGLPLDIRQNAG